MKFSYGVWGSDKDGESSNLKELKILVDTLKEMTRDKDGVIGVGLFLFTDNSVAECDYFKGSSTSVKLFELVLEFKMMELEYGMIIHFIHVAGTCMISQNTDGLSRGTCWRGSC